MSDSAPQEREVPAAVQNILRIHHDSELSAAQKINLSFKMDDSSGMDEDFHENRRKKANEDAKRSRDDLLEKKQEKKQGFCGCFSF